MNIQEALEDFSEGDILFLGSKTSYIEENASSSEENISTSATALKHLGAPDGTLLRCLGLQGTCA